QRDDVAYILDTFPIMKRKEMASHGEYRTKRVILEVYDAMHEATRRGVQYQTRLDPPPAHPSLADGVMAAAMRRIAAVPDDVPPWVPHLDPIYIVFALMHACGGSIATMDLARAFVLWSQPGRLARAAPTHLSNHVEQWLSR